MSFGVIDGAPGLARSREIAPRLRCGPTPRRRQNRIHAAEVALEAWAFPAYLRRNITYDT
jgi:hypothetical protein